jgi:hypothetical protein
MTRALFFFAFSAYAAGNPIPSGFLNHPLAFEPNRGQAATGFNSWHAGTPVTIC